MKKEEKGIKNIRITLHNTEELYSHPIGFKLIEPDGITFFYTHGIITMPLEEAQFTVEVIKDDSNTQNQ